MPPEEPQQNPYELLGISQDVTEAEIRTAYRTRSLKVHPDRNRNDPKAVRHIEYCHRCRIVATIVAPSLCNVYSQRGSPNITSTPFKHMDQQWRMDHLKTLEAKPITYWRLMLRDGLNLYAAILLVNLVNVLFYFIMTPTGPTDPIKMIVTSMAGVLTTTMSMRIILAVRGDLTNGGSYSASSHVASSSGGHTHTLSGSGTRARGANHTFTLCDMRDSSVVAGPRKEGGQWDVDKSSISEGEPREEDSKGILHQALVIMDVFRTDVKEFAFVVTSIGCCGHFEVHSNIVHRHDRHSRDLNRKLPATYTA